MQVKTLIINVPKKEHLSSPDFFTAADIPVIKAKIEVKKTLEQIANEHQSPLFHTYIKNVYVTKPEMDNGSPGFKLTGIKGKLEFAVTELKDIVPYLSELSKKIEQYGFTVDQDYRTEEK